MDGYIVVLLIILVLAFLLVLWVFVKNARRKVLGLKQEKYIKSHWVKAIANYENNPAQAVMEADKILDYALKFYGFEGALGEKLKKAAPRFSDINSVWRAHKLRNRIAHELSDIDKKEALSALKAFKKALRDLGVNF